jgi:hypothetical protein
MPANLHARTSVQHCGENGIGSPDRTRFILNIQPVMPFALSDKTNLIAEPLEYAGEPHAVEAVDIRHIPRKLPGRLGLFLHVAR